MKTTLGAFISGISFLLSPPAMAQNNDNHQPTDALVVAPIVLAQAEKTGMDNVKDGISDAATSTKDTIKETYTSIKTTLIDDDKGPMLVSLNPRMSANGILSEPVMNTEETKLGTIEDIILLDKSGKADMIIINHGGYFKVGSDDAAFDYDLVMRHEADGDIIMPLSQKAIEKAESFSYDRNNTDKNTRVIPAQGISIKGLLNSMLLDSDGKNVGKTDNIYLNKGTVSHVVFSFDTTMGIGGKKVIIKFDELKLTDSQKGYQFHLNTVQSKQFKNFKETATQ